MLLPDEGEASFAAEDAPGLVIVDRSFTVRSTSPGIERWLRRLPDSGRSGGGLPTAVLSVAAAALRAADRNEATAEALFARVASPSGGRLVLYGTHVPGQGGTEGIAVIIEQASPGRMLPLLMSAYGLTDRERDVVRLILRGKSTAQIAACLFVTPHTVQQHLKNVFAKTGVRSRRDLVGILLSGQY